MNIHISDELQKKIQHHFKHGYFQSENFVNVLRELNH